MTWFSLPGSMNLSVILNSHRQDHVSKVMLFICGGQHDGAEVIGQLQHHFLGGNDLQRIGQVAHIEADLQIPAIAGHGTAILCLTDGGGGLQLQQINSRFYIICMKKKWHLLTGLTL